MLLEDFGEALGATGKEYAQRIADSAERQGLLLSDLLKHVSLGREHLPLTEVDLARVIRQAQADLVVEVQQRAATITVETLHRQVFGNEASLHLVVLNLLSNALKFVAPGVKPSIRIGSQLLPRAAGAHEGNEASWVQLWVEDNGIGIRPEHLGKLFQVFQRLQSSPRYPGTGIGLAIVKKAAERMGGRVGVSSELGRGSRFWVELRATPPAQ
jgi:signal transduction histidine kinase